MRLIFLGPPGAGKGTQAQLLAQRQGVEHLSSGDLLRGAAQRSDPIGQQLERIIRQGGLVPDSLVTGLVLSRIEQVGEGRSFVLDGFPRTVEQAVALDQHLKRKGHLPMDLALNFEMEDEAVVVRLAGRRMCAKCGANYHVQRLQPQRQGICDRCGGELIRRADDQPETIRKRLSLYHEETMPLLDFYRRQGKLRAVPGDLQVEEQYGALWALLKSEPFVS